MGLTCFLGGADGLVRSRVQRRKPTAVDHQESVGETITSEGERPSWATGTALYPTIGQLIGVSMQPWEPISEPAGMPLPKRAPSWLTRQGEEVTVGDLVALSVLTFPDAKGRIVGAAGEGLVECTLGDHDDPHGTRPRLRIDADNILMLLRKA